MSTLRELLGACGLGDYQQKFENAGFKTVEDLRELTDFEASPDNKGLFNTLCGEQIGLNGIQRLKLLKQLKPGEAKPQPMEEEDQKVDETTPGAKSKAGEKEGPAMIDLAFVLDTTASMGSYIRSAQQNIKNIVAKVKAEQNADVRFALVSYKDYNNGDEVMTISHENQAGKVSKEKMQKAMLPDTTGSGSSDEPMEEAPETEGGFFATVASAFGIGGSSKKKSKVRRKKKSSRMPSSRRSHYGGRNGFDDQTAVRVYEFSSQVKAIQQYVDKQKATGGGDGPEAVATALHCTEHLHWREGAAKIAVLIADAPPHGVEPSGDSFPDGDPGCRDPLVIARALADKDITIYTVACEPSVTNSYQFCRDFMDGIAEIGGGMLVPLANAKMLTDMILASCKEGADLTKIQEEVQKELAKIKKEKPEADEETMATLAAGRLAARGIETYQTRDTSMAYAKFNRSNALMLSDDKATLKSCKSRLRAQAAPAGWDSGFASQTLTSSKATFSAKQCSRMMKKKKRSKGWGF